MKNAVISEKHAFNEEKWQQGARIVNDALKSRGREQATASSKPPYVLRSAEVLRASMDGNPAGEKVVTAIQVVT